jgi:glucokinase
MSDDLILAGDIGGTKCNLAFFSANGPALEALNERCYPSRDFASLDAVAKQFFTDTGLSADRACFGVAGAVLGGESQLPNLGWRLS